MKYRILSFLLLLCISACQPVNRSSLQTIAIEPVNTSIANLSGITDRLEIITLETNDSCLISRVHDLIRTEDYIFIHDFSNIRILQFNTKGKFIRQIGRAGRGPEEYPRINSFICDESLGDIIICTGKKILVYDFDGLFVKEIPYKKFVSDIYMINNKVWTISEEMGIVLSDGSYLNRAKIHKLNSEYSIVDSLVIKEIRLEGLSGTSFGNSSFISENENSTWCYYPVLLKNQTLRDTLYRLEDDKLVPAIKLSFAKFQNTGDPSATLLISNVFRTEDYLFANYLLNGMKLFCTRLSTGESWNMEEGFDDDLQNTGTVKIMPLDLRNGKFCFVKDGYELIDIVDNISEDDNPVLFFFKLD